MTNPSKQKGTAYETALVTMMRDEWYIDAYRRPLTGGSDQGDIGVHSHPDITIEAKNHKAMQLSAWMDQLEVEKVNAHATIAVLAVKRRGKTAAGSYFIVDGESLERLLDAWMVTR
jgi:hypothetical protein